MKKFKTRTLLGLAMVLVAVSAAGCKGPKPGPTSRDFEVPEGGYDGSSVTIRFYHTMGQTLQPILDSYIDEFNELYPNITVESLSLGAYNDVRDQLKNDLSVGAQANLSYCYPDHIALYNKTNKVITLDSLIDSTAVQADQKNTGGIIGLTAEEKADFVEAYYEEGRQFGDGKMYCLPFSKSTEVLYYNKTYFEANNLTVPTTWVEMENVCEQILTLEKAKDPVNGGKIVPLGYDSASNLFITMCEQYDSPYTSVTAPHFLFNNPKNKEIVTMIKGWYDKGYMTTKDLYGSYTSGLFTTDDPVHCVMCIGSSAGSSYQLPEKMGENYRFEVGIASIPQADKVNHPAVISQGPSVCIFNSEDPQKVMASWLLLKFLTTSVDFQAEFSMVSGYTPVIKSVYENPVYKNQFLDLANGGDYIQALSTKVCTEQSSYYFYSPAFVGSSTARDQVGFVISQALGSKDITNEIDEIFRKAVEECEYETE